jgi:deazaflavin-dependent oxidoreductase (nitroreductase family)
MTLGGDKLDRFASYLTIDLTTYGRRTGLPRRIEIWWFRVDGRFVITGTPGRRDWLANVLSNPRVIVHVDGKDLKGRATPVHDREFRRAVFTDSNISWYSTQAQLERLVKMAPMIEIEFLQSWPESARASISAR